MIEDIDIGDVVAYYYCDENNPEVTGFYLGEVYGFLEDDSLLVNEIYTTSQEGYLEPNMEVPGEYTVLLGIVEKRTPTKVLMDRIIAKYPEYTL